MVYIIYMIGFREARVMYMILIFMEFWDFRFHGAG